MPVNDPPVISPFEIQSSLEDESLTINIDANDIDGDDLFFGQVKLKMLKST